MTIGFYPSFSSSSSLRRTFQDFLNNSTKNGRVAAKNADNAQTGLGALWEYSSYVGGDNMLSASELSGARALKFNNPNNEAFTVTFNVIGNLARGSSSSSSSASATSSSSSAQTDGSSPPGSANPSGAAGTVTSMVFKVVYNPLLNTVTVQLIKL